MIVSSSLNDPITGHNLFFEKNLNPGFDSNVRFGSERPLEVIEFIDKDLNSSAWRHTLSQSRKVIWIKRIYSSHH